MSARTKLAVVLITAAGLWFTAPTGRAQEAGPTITIANTGSEPPYTFSPAQLDAKVGEPITVTNNDANGVHSVTAADKTFNVDVPPKSSVTFKVSKAGTYDYVCQYHTDAHNAASLNVS